MDEEVKKVTDAELTAQLLNDPFAVAIRDPNAAEIKGGKFPKAPRALVHQSWPHTNVRSETPKPAPIRRGIPW